jgi:ring-1,2-phenylacetyl-CoA epoxidase subunit PaaE
MSTQVFHLNVNKVVKETADAISIHFNTPQPVAYKPGQFLTIILNINGKQVRRAYSLFTSPFEDDHLAVTVKRVDGGLVSNHLNDTLKAGDTLEVLAPVGNFTAELDAAQQRHLVLFGGGSGITPLMSIARAALYKETGTQVSLVYANRDVNSIIFRQHLEALTRQYGDRFRVVHVLEQSADGFLCRPGRVCYDMIEDILREFPVLSPDRTEYFICGPDGMMQQVIATLDRLGVSKERIHKESFVSLVDEAARQEAVEEEGVRTQSVKIINDGNEYTFVVEPYQTILEAALDQDIDLPYSCQSGMCTACRGKALSGKVYLDENDGLSEKELELGYVLTCVGHPLTSDVVIEIG